MMALSALLLAIGLGFIVGLVSIGIFWERRDEYGVGGIAGLVRAAVRIWALAIVPIFVVLLIVLVSA